MSRNVRKPRRYRRIFIGSKQTRVLKQDFRVAFNTLQDQMQSQEIEIDVRFSRFDIRSMNGRVCGYLKKPNRKMIPFRIHCSAPNQARLVLLNSEGAITRDFGLSVTGKIIGQLSKVAGGQS